MPNPLPENPAPRPLPIGIVGLNFGKHVLAVLEKEPASLYFKTAAVCDLDAAKVEDLSLRHGVPGLPSLDALLERSDIPVIGLFTGPEKRADLLRKIIRKGKDVVTTKPFELDSRAARHILEEAVSLGRIIHLNSPAPEPSAAIRKIREWEATHRLGRPVFCRGEMTASYREKADGSWYDDHLRCPLAPIFRLGIYMINDFVRLFGRVREVQVLSSRIFTGRPTPDNAQLSLLFEGGIIGNIYASFCVGNGQFYANSFTLHYENGTVHHNLQPCEYGKAGAGSRLQLIATHGGEKVLTEEWGAPENSGLYQWKAFHQAVLERNIGSMPIEETVQGIEVIEAMILAEQSRQIEIIRK